MILSVSGRNKNNRQVQVRRGQSQENIQGNTDPDEATTPSYHKTVPGESFNTP